MEDSDIHLTPQTTDPPPQLPTPPPPPGWFAVDNTTDVATPSSESLPFVCPDCMRSFTSRSGLRRHQRCHCILVKKDRRNRCSLQQSPPPHPPSSESPSGSGVDTSGSASGDSPIIPGDFGWVLKPTNDTPSVSWTDDSFQYTVQNPANWGNVLLKIQLYHRDRPKHICGVYLDEKKDDEICIMLMDLITRLEDLWVDRCTGLPRVAGLTQTKRPLAAWRKIDRALATITEE
jgi:hypothetical protein